MGEVTKKKLEKLNIILNSVNIQEIDSNKSNTELLTDLTDRDQQIRVKLNNKINSLGADGQSWVNSQIDELTRSSDEKLKKINEDFQKLTKKYQDMIVELAKKQVETIATKLSPGLVTTAKQIAEIAKFIDEIQRKIDKDITGKITNAKIDISIFMDKQLAKIINAEIPKDYKRDTSDLA